MIEVLKTIIKDFHKKGVPELFKREIKIPISTDKIITLVGSRRAGKTYMLYNLISDIIQKISIENIIYINFEDERLNLEKEDLGKIIDAYLELYPEKDMSKIYLFFDEIQDINGWEKFVRRMYDSVTKNIFITGSSARLLSKEIATSLRGRTISYEIYPLSFKEYLSYNSIDAKDIHSTQNKAKIKSAFNKFLMLGSYPETLNMNEDISIKTLQSYVDVMIYKDLVDRYKIKKPETIKLFIKKCITYLSKDFSINKTYNEFKSMGVKISKDTMYSYSKHVEDIFLIFFINVFNPSLILQESYTKKAYCIDNGLANSYSFKNSHDKGRLLENLVFLELKRKSNKIYFHKKKKECDFIVQKSYKIVQAIQVTQNLENTNTKKREIDGLLDALDTYKLKQGFILTGNEEEEIKVGDKIIIICPVWKWLLKY
ncbi:MAG: ATP-binding protein [Nanoarchaeota archaeon]|nr:ATP-binding protein [Nanoarchaeota archaeon]MBU4116688.1 ATP-binding protein [Nanoarchaeota archaeon]